jgi:hypothetical protein
MDQPCSALILSYQPLFSQAVETALMGFDWAIWENGRARKRKREMERKGEKHNESVAG